MKDISSESQSNERMQNTLADEVSLSGIGLHSGEEVSLRFCPAEEDSGIVFQRVDLPGKPLIPATVENVVDTSRNTTIGVGDVQVFTVEHILAALRAYNVDNARIEVSAMETPICDGSSLPFVELIEKARIHKQNKPQKRLKLKHPVYWSKGDVHLVAIPDETFRISYTLHYPECKVLQSQYFSFELTPENFKELVAPCRTFSRYEEISYLMDRGLIKGGSLSNAVVIKDDVILSKGGLHFPNEMVRHKVLDVVGDLSLVGAPFDAHIITVRSGHQANCMLAKEIRNYFKGR